MSINEIPDEKNNQEYVEKGIWGKAKETLGKVPFVPDAVAMYFCAIDPKTPIHARILIFASLAYFISPIDAIPDAIPVAGYTDDAGSIAAALAAIGVHITDEHRQKAQDWLNDKK